MGLLNTRTQKRRLEGAQKGFEVVDKPTGVTLYTVRHVQGQPSEYVLNICPVFQFIPCDSDQDDVAQLSARLSGSFKTAQEAERYARVFILDNLYLMALGRVEALTKIFGGSG